MKPKGKSKVISNNNNPLSSNAFWPVSKSINKLCIENGLGIEASAYLSFLVSSHDYLNIKGYINFGEHFYCNQASIFKKIGVSVYKQNTYLQFFLGRGFVEIEKKGIPQKIFYTINFSKIEDYIRNAKNDSIIELEGVEEEDYIDASYQYEDDF